MAKKKAPPRRKRRRRRRTDPPWYRDPTDWKSVAVITAAVCGFVAIGLWLTVNKFNGDEIRELGMIAVTVATIVKTVYGKA